MSKLKIFQWQLRHASLPTRGNLLARGLDIDPLCPHCNTTIEDNEHLFLRCPNAQVIWQLAHDHNWVTVDATTRSPLTLPNWLSFIKQSVGTTKLDRIVALLMSIWKTRNNIIFRNDRIVALLWSIWKTRNNIIFRNESASLNVTIL